MPRSPLLSNLVSRSRAVKFCLFCSAVLGFSSAYAQWSIDEERLKEHPVLPQIKENFYYLVDDFSKEDWDKYPFASDEKIQWFRDARYGMFIHFGLSTKEKLEVSWGSAFTRKAPDYGNGPIPDEEWTSWTEDFKFEEFDAKEWVKLCQDAGFKYMVLIAKHHEGFHLWDTAESEFKITNTPFGRDYIKEVVEACQEVGMPVGLYYSQRDWYHPDYQPVDEAKVDRDTFWWTLKEGFDSPIGERHAKYLEYQRKVVEELVTNYGKIDIFWWDALTYGGMFTPEMWESEELEAMIREKQPHIIINNRASLPGDFDTPEQRLGFFQNWRPWESCVSLTDTWGYSDTESKSLNTLIYMLTQSVCNDGNLLLSLGPKWNGAFDEDEKQRLLEVGEWLKVNGEAIYETRGGPWKIGPWGGSTHRGNTAYLHILDATESISLPTITDVSVKSASLLDGTEVSFTESKFKLSLQLPEREDTGKPLIVKLTMGQSLASVTPLETATLSLFDDEATYGKLLSAAAEVSLSSEAAAQNEDQQAELDAMNLANLVNAQKVERWAVKTGEEEQPWIQVDLGEERLITGARISRDDTVVNHENKYSTEPTESLSMLISSDGENWEQVWSAGAVRPVWEAPITQYRAGAKLPGRPARFVRLQIAPQEPMCLKLRKLELFGKSMEEAAEAAVAE